MRVPIIALVAVLAASSLAAPALADGFLAIDGITPSSTATGSWSAGSASATSSSWLPLESYQLTPGSGTARGKVSVTRVQDALSIKIMGAGNHVYAKAVLDVPDTNNLQIVYQMTNVTISDYQASGSGNGPPQESFTLTFQKLTSIDKTSQPTINGVALTIPELVRTPAALPSAVAKGKGW